MKKLFDKLSQHIDLTQSEMEEIFEKILKGEVSESQIAAFLMGLKVKGETDSEITGIVNALKKHALRLPKTFNDAMCNCGTGGDQSNSFNISTTVSFILAAGGIRVAKAGNSSVSSQSGSADVLEELGINISASPDVLSQSLEKVGISFMFAQSLHPAMRFIGQARRELGIPTVMNIVGPLSNPVDLETQMMGLYRQDLQEIAVKVMRNLGRKRALVITGPDNLDEAALYGKNHYTLLENGKISKGSFTYKDLGMQEVNLSKIKGGTARENAEILISVLKGEESPYLETSVLNAGLAFFANGLVETIKDGVTLSRQLLGDGSAYQKLLELREIQR